MLLYPLATAMAAGWLILLQGPLRAIAFLGNHSRLQDGTFNSKRIRGTAVSTANCFLDPNAPIRRSAAPDPCHAVRSPDRPTLFFEGDSHTHALIPLGGEILSRGHANVAFHARGGCPFPYFEPWRDNAQRSERYRLCRPHFENAMERISASLHPGDRLVLVSSLPNYFTSLTGTALEAAKASYGARIQRIAATAQSRGAGVILFGPLPSFEQKKIAIPLSLCSPEWFRPLWAIDPACRPVVRGRGEVLHEIQYLKIIQAELAARLKGVTLFDPFESVCPEEDTQCSTHRGLEPIYSDGNHLTHAGAVSLYPRFQSFLDRLDSSPRH